MRGKKGDLHADPTDPPRRRANKQRGHGTYANDRPPIVGTAGRESGQVRLRLVQHTDRETLCRHVHTFTQAGVQVYTDAWPSYQHIIRPHATVCHGAGEWARDDDGDGIREVHVNTLEGLWTSVRSVKLAIARGIGFGNSQRMMAAGTARAVRGRISTVSIAIRTSLR